LVHENCFKKVYYGRYGTYSKATGREGQRKLIPIEGNGGSFMENIQTHLEIHLNARAL
jgi:hypothetical protein